MFRWLQTIGSESPGMDEIHRHFLQMLDDGRHVFDAAANTLLGGGAPEVVREDLFTTDQRINLTEQKVRRELVVHGTVHGSSSLPALLLMMSLVKDAERIGDYGKNIFELACLTDVQLGTDEDRQKLVALKDTISKMLVRARGILDSQDESSASAFLKEADNIQKECDAQVDGRLTTSGHNEAQLVLVYRYFKRVVSHAGNIVTSIVMPLDKLDYYPGKPHSEQ